MENNDEDQRSTNLLMLPEGCITDILALTSPPDVGRISSISTFVRSAAESDSVWSKFLPSDYQAIIARSLSPVPDLRSNKELYVYLSHHPILIDGGRKSFSLEKWTGKKCYFLGARDLKIVWGDTPKYWKWTSLPESRFPEVAVLEIVYWLEICGAIRAGILSPRTSYSAYLVYKFIDEYGEGFDYRPSEVSVGISGFESEKGYAFLHPDGECQQDDIWNPEEEPYTPPHDSLDAFGRYSWHYDPSIMQADKQLPKLRDDGWFEVKLGEFISENEDDCIEMNMQEVEGGFAKLGLVVEGIEIRPRRG